MISLGRIRRLRFVPRALLAVLLLTVGQTALLPCAMAKAAPYSSVSGTSGAVGMAGMEGMEHCAYCPQDNTVVTPNDCIFPHGPSMNVFAASAHHVDILLTSPMLQPATFDAATLNALSASPSPEPLTDVPQRPLTLTHCVQLK